MMGADVLAIAGRIGAELGCSDVTVRHRCMPNVTHGTVLVTLPLSSAPPCQPVFIQANKNTIVDSNVEVRHLILLTALCKSQA